MYYKIAEKLEEVKTDDRFQFDTPVIAVLSQEEWRTDYNKKLGFPKVMEEDFSRTHHTKAEVYGEYIAGAFVIPNRDNILGPKDNFLFFMNENCIAFVDNEEFVSEIVANLADTKKYKESKIELFIFDFLWKLVENDLEVLENYNNSILEIEERVLDREMEDFNREIITLRKGLLELERHYVQLVAVSEELAENENGFFDKDYMHSLRLFSDRVRRMQSDARRMLDYSMQVREVYQSQVELKQNSIIQMFTVVTTIFFPLTVITGWYGMNFINMPELNYKYGYVIIIAVSILIVAGCIIYFRKKKIF